MNQISDIMSKKVEIIKTSDSAKDAAKKMLQSVLNFINKN